tara:strand:- start:2768 stop:3040 length:273 start_codon:yes stop_codon:yes gene_type:complete
MTSRTFIQAANKEKYREDEMTEGQKRKISYELSRHGIKGEEMNWEKLDKFLCMGIIDKLVSGSPWRAMQEMQDHGFIFSKHDWDKAFKIK